MATKPRTLMGGQTDFTNAALSGFKLDKAEATRL